jgi:hypothetical protein
MRTSTPLALTVLALTTAAVLAKSDAVGGADSQGSVTLASRIHSNAGMEGDITIGQAVSEGTALRLIPRHETYRYAVVKGHRLIVDAGTRKVVYVID